MAFNLKAIGFVQQSFLTAHASSSGNKSKSNCQFGWEFSGYSLIISDRCQRLFSLCPSFLSLESMSNHRYTWMEWIRCCSFAPFKLPLNNVGPEPQPIPIPVDLSAFDFVFLYNTGKKEGNNEINMAGRNGQQPATSDQQQQSNSKKKQWGPNYQKEFINGE